MIAVENITPGMDFLEDSHTYLLNGNRVPGVTEIIHAAQMVDGSHWDEFACNRGLAVHAAIHYIEEGDLDWSSVDPAIEPYLVAYQAFMADMVEKTFLSERRLVHKSLRYGGTLDRLCWIRANHFRGAFSIVDFKTGAWNPSYEVQLAAYHLLVDDNAAELGLRPSELPTEHIVVQLMPNGRYRATKSLFTPSRARNLFMSALSIYSYRREFNLLPKEQ